MLHGVQEREGSGGLPISLCFPWTKLPLCLSCVLAISFLSVPPITKPVSEPYGRDSKTVVLERRLAFFFFFFFNLVFKEILCVDLFYFGLKGFIANLGFGTSALGKAFFLSGYSDLI